MINATCIVKAAGSFFANKYPDEDTNTVCLCLFNGYPLSSELSCLHSMNIDKTNQIIGRGQRPGRTSELNVWKLCYETEL